MSNIGPNFKIKHETILPFDIQQLIKEEINQPMKNEGKVSQAIQSNSQENGTNKGEIRPPSQQPAQNPSYFSLFKKYLDKNPILKSALWGLAIGLGVCVIAGITVGLLIATGGIAAVPLGVGGAVAVGAVAAGGVVATGALGFAIGAGIGAIKEFVLGDSLAESENIKSQVEYPFNIKGKTTYATLSNTLNDQEEKQEEKQKEESKQHLSSGPGFGG